MIFSSGSNNTCSNRPGSVRFRTVGVAPAPGPRIRDAGSLIEIVYIDATPSLGAYAYSLLREGRRASKTGCAVIKVKHERLEKIPHASETSQQGSVY